MEFSLTLDEQIILYLRYLIPIPEICYHINNIKKKMEDIETYKYHLDRWETIAGEHYLVRDTHYDKFSYVLNEDMFIIKPDHRLNFYRITGISYQVIELIQGLIKIKNEINGPFIQFTSHKEWLTYDDNLYSELAKRIMDHMNKLKTNKLIN